MGKKIIDLLQKTCKEHGEIKYDFHYREWKTDFLRFYRSNTNYNISKQLSALTASVFKGKKQYTFELANPSEEQFKNSIQKALSVIDKLPEDPDFVDIEDNQEKGKELEKADNTQIVTMKKKVEILQEAAEAVKQYGFKIYGTFICNYQIDHIVNSNGVNKRMISSPIMLELKAMSDRNEVTVIESYGSEDISTFDLKNFLSRLMEKVEIANKEVIDVEPDHYEVILSPRCMAELFGYLVWGGMTASAYDKKRSYFEDKLNQKIFPENINLTDDPEYPGIISFDYNSDGHIYRPLKLIENGVFRNFLVDNYYSHKT